jgi:hypothetical protein
MIKKFNQFINEAMATAYDEFGGGERRDNEYGFELACKKVIFDKLRIPIENQKNVDSIERSKLKSEHGVQVPVGIGGKGFQPDGTFGIVNDTLPDFPDFSGHGDYNSIVDDFKKKVNVSGIEVYQLNGDVWEKWSNGKVVPGKSVKADREWRDRGRPKDSWGPAFGW